MENQVKFTEAVIVPMILAEELKNLKLVNADASSNAQIDGFMGNIIFLNLELKTPDKKFEKREIVVKLMKPPSPARDLYLSDIQFVNEIFIYSNVVPTFLRKFQKKFVKTKKNLWCPKVYLAEVGKYKQLSNQTETILALENLTPQGFRLGNRNHLSPDELMLMTTAIAQYHACTYALRILGDQDLEKLIGGIIPLAFVKEGGNSLYDVVYQVALERIFKYLDETPEEIDSDIFKNNLAIFRRRYEKHPLKLMERFRRVDETFSVILHGDYNRNNVLFKYETVNGKEIPVDLRFIDFQEVRYGTPAIDLAFFMYMNMHPSLLKTDLFEQLLENYHSCLIETICELLSCKETDKRLDVYSYENFYNHFKQFAFYGAMVSIHFTPWMACPEEECEQLSALFEKDMHSAEFHNLAMICGGKEVNQRITAVTRHACKSGFMEMIGKDEN